MSKTLFDRYPKTTLLIIWVVLGVVALACLEWGAKQFGLGEVVVYGAHPIHGYRPLPNQDLQRFGGSRIKFNNLALRADQNWDARTDDKILFLGDSVTYGGSYIDNNELFSELAVKNLPLKAGNAGVNGWGVLNVHALVKELEFLPANTYVSMFPEGDFYRGLTRLGGQPYWTKKADYALEELFFYGLYKLYLRKSPGLNYAALNDDEKSRLVNLAARQLKEMDDFLKSKGFKHIVVITPSRSQALLGHPKDSLVEQALKSHQLDAIYLLDKMQTIQAKDEWFHDEIHLTKEGHAQWGKWLKQELESTPS